MTIKKLKKATFTIKIRRIFNIDDIDFDKKLVSKKEQYQKWPAILINLMKIK